MKPFRELQELRKHGITLRSILRSVHQLKRSGEINNECTAADVAEMVLLDIKADTPTLVNVGFDFDWETIIELIIKILMAFFGL